MGEPETAKWYVIHTYAGYESLVQDTIEKLIENNDLRDIILDIKIPMEETIEEKNGKKKIVQRKIFPCYVFIKMVYSNDMWYLITNTRGVTGFVGPQGKAIPLGADEVRKMRLEEKVVESDIAVGDSVRVISGALVDSVGVVEDINNSTQKVKIRMSLFGTETEAEVDLIQLDKINTNIE